MSKTHQPRDTDASSTPTRPKFGLTGNIAFNWGQHIFSNAWEQSGNKENAQDNDKFISPNPYASWFMYWPLNRRR
ncbi:MULTISPECIES: hypothetical protein [Salinivibrio]|uniref:hypothetical protein n=1 Tax=Salinivibrio TaxID=51366 RepID=UPI000984D9D9|nr:MULTISPECIES: hypothetical protein [Salinivibrio]OOF10431.1 hypothetical protein BZG82_07495 [Salinivibrio sp. PR5]OOF12841.1 hypothetical protein BZG83_10525 [Salinivibrio sp. PR919]OOF16883.1 hypothetical protein BZG84_09110 [Salinivibrio sp. PR932]OOF32254.1 hypothetical protein BZJ20_00035 [Salinivibrio proteolyticus]